MLTRKVYIGTRSFNIARDSFTECFFRVLTLSRSLICTVKIESTGVLPPEVLFTEAVKILEDKCDRVISDLS